MGYKKSPETAAMKHGKALEPHAKSFYLSIAKKSHRKLKSAETGLVIMDQKPFIGVSPDLEVDCECCGKGLVEIKCPYSIRDTAPTAENLSYLQTSDGKVQLKTNSEYYYQVQGQMAVTGRLYTDFVIFTCHGNLIQRIKFDSCFWEGMLNKLEWFWVNCLCSELLTKKIKPKQLPEYTEIPTTVSPVTRKDGNYNSKSPVTNCDSSGFQITSRVRVSSHSVSLSASYNSKADPVQLPLQTLQNNKRQAQKKKREIEPVSRKMAKQNPVYLCGSCQKDVVEKPKQFSEESIGCDRCPLWYHFVCVGITEKNRPHGKTNGTAINVRCEVRTI